MIRRIARHTLFIVAVAAVAAACKKKESEGEAKPAPAAGKGGETAAPPAAPAKASREECEQVVANQLALEVDPSIRSAMEQSKEAMTTGCLDAMTSSQAQCAAKATSASAFGDCMLQK